MSTYKLATDGVLIDIAATNDEDALVEAKTLLGSEEPGDATYWVKGILTEFDDEGDEVGEWKLRVAIHPAEPRCDYPEGHDWQSPVEVVGGIPENPGVWGHGGGVIVHEVCMNCACARVVDTWATDPTDGTQYHRTVRYEPRRYTEELAALAAEDEE